MLIVSNRPPLFTRVILVDDDLDSADNVSDDDEFGQPRPSANIPGSLSNRDTSRRVRISLRTPFTRNARKHGPRISSRRARTLMRLSDIVFGGGFFFQIRRFGDGYGGGKEPRNKKKSPQSRRVHTLHRYCLADRSSFVLTHMAAQEVCHKVIRTPCKSFPSLVI